MEIDVLWEYDNKIIIDEELGKQRPKKVRRGFKRYFVFQEGDCKKLEAKFAF